MRKKIGCGLSLLIALGVIYLTEAVILGFVYHFMAETPYKLVAPPIVIAAMLGAWIAIFVDVKKAGKR